MFAEGWHQGLYRRMAIGAGVLITLVLTGQTLLFMYLFRQMNNVNLDDLHQRGVTWTRAISDDLGQRLEQSRTLDVAQRLTQLDATQRVFVIFRDGRMLGLVPPANVIDVVASDFATIPEAGPVPASWERSPYCASPLKVDGRVVGVVGINPLSTLQRLWPLIGAAGIAVLVGAIALFSFAMVGPVRARLSDLRAAAIRLGEGQFETRVKIEGTDEVAQVARAFNSMADELEKRTTALETSDRLRRQLVADVSHELMTPLTAVLGHLETLDMDEVTLDERQRRKQVAIAMREARRLRRVIGDLLDTARYEAGGVQLDVEEISTTELFKQVAARHEHECRVRDMTFDSSVSPDAETFEADPFRIEQAIENVVSNAFRHAPNHGRISLTAQRSGNNIVIEVCDSGEGIAAEHLPHIFDRFYKASAARSIASPGSGLGLSIVKAIVTRHGGQVSATSAGGIGTIIRMEFPAAAVLTESALQA